MVKKFTNISINMALDLETDLKFACWGEERGIRVASGVLL